MRLFFLIYILFNIQSYSQQVDMIDILEDDLNIGGDIFNDFNESLEESRTMEDERFFNRSRFFTFDLGIGLTTFNGNRGSAYEDDGASYALGINYFSDFQTTFGIGFEYSAHHFFLSEKVHDYPEGPIGLVNVSMFRTYFSTRYFIDTSDLGTAITYSNPYFIGRIEYWTRSNSFFNQDGDIEDTNAKGGGIGVSVGMGLEFPIKVKESYIGVEVLWHNIEFDDKYTQSYRPIPGVSSFGWEDFTGDSWSLMTKYIISW